MSFRLHTKGSDCSACCCSGATKCDETEGCTGHIHQDVVDEIQVGDDDWSWCHNYKCDTCGHENYFSSDLPVEFEEADAT